MEDLTFEELKELKLSVNEMISRRIQYGFSKDNQLRLDLNQKYLTMDYHLLEVIIKEMESRR